MSSNSIVTLDAPQVEALRTVLRYLEDEERHYEEYVHNGFDTDGHIFNSIRKLAAAVR
jgi:hypothetical protein